MTNVRGRFSVVEKIAAGELFRGDSTTRAPFPKQRFEDGFGYSDFRRRVAAHRTFRKGVTAWKYVTAPKHKKVENMKEGKWENGFFGQDDSPGTVIIRMRRTGIQDLKGRGCLQCEPFVLQDGFRQTCGLQRCARLASSFV